MSFRTFLYRSICFSKAVSCSFTAHEGQTFGLYICYAFMDFACRIDSGLSNYLLEKKSNSLSAILSLFRKSAWEWQPGMLISERSCKAGVSVKFVSSVWRQETAISTLRRLFLRSLSDLFLSFQFRTVM